MESRKEKFKVVLHAFLSLQPGDCSQNITDRTLTSGFSCRQTSVIRRLLSQATTMMAP